MPASRRKRPSVFIDRPHAAPDNHLAELALRDAVMGRRLGFSSDTENGAEFTAMMYSVAGTPAMNAIDVRRRLDGWWTVCAKNRGKPPDDLLPWCYRRREVVGVRPVRKRRSDTSVNY